MELGAVAMIDCTFDRAELQNARALARQCRFSAAALLQVMSRARNDVPMTRLMRISFIRR